MNFLKKLWQKLFGLKTESIVTKYLNTNRPAYDPSQDENKIMSGEYESYFD